MSALGCGLNPSIAERPITPATAAAEGGPATERSALLVLVMGQGLAQCPSDSDTRCRSDGSNSTSNHGFLRSQILFLGLGCGSSLAIFTIDDVLESPRSIDMHWDIKIGKEWLDEFVPIDNEIYEFADTKKISKKNLK